MQRPFTAINRSHNYAYHLLEIKRIVVDAIVQQKRATAELLVLAEMVDDAVDDVHHSDFDAVKLRQNGHLDSAAPRLRPLDPLAILVVAFAQVRRIVGLQVLGYRGADDLAHELAAVSVDAPVQQIAYAQVERTRKTQRSCIKQVNVLLGPYAYRCW